MHMSSSAPPAALAFAMSDPTGAGGVRADSLARVATGCHVACAITGVVVQHSRRVEHVLVVDDRPANDQALAALLAQGIDVGDAVREANEFLELALAGGFRLGIGGAVPDAHSFSANAPPPAPDDDDAR